MRLKSFLLCLLLSLSLSFPAFSLAPEDVRFSVISNQEQILVIVSQLSEYYNLQDSIIAQEKESLKADRDVLTKDREELTQEKQDFENWKASQEKDAPDLLKLTALYEKQSKQLKVAGTVIKVGGIAFAVSLAINGLQSLF